MHVSSAQKLDSLGKIKEHAPRSEHVHLRQNIGHTRESPSSHAAASTFKVCAPTAEYTDVAHNMFGQIKIKVPWYSSRHTPAF